MSFLECTFWCIRVKNPYIDYLLRSLWPEDIDAVLVSNATAGVFAAVTVASLVRFRAFRRHTKTRWCHAVL